VTLWRALSGKVVVRMNQSKIVVRRLFDEVLNQRKLKVLDKIISSGYTDHNPVPGLPGGARGIRMKLESFYESFPDLEFVLEDLISEGDMVAARYHWHATHNGEFLGIQPTGRQVTVNGMDFYRVKDSTDL
jgi:predicted ester cyclase